jgi:hypothetical protein
MNREEKISKFIYHFGKATWKMVPVIGPFVEELVYEQFKDKLMPQLKMLSENDLFEIEKRIPKIDFERIDEGFNNISLEMKETMSQNFLSLFEFIEHRVKSEIIEEISENKEISLSIVEIVKRIEQNIGNEAALRNALNEINTKRELWIERISTNQKLLLERIPTDYMNIDQLWELTKSLIPECGYKEFRFRLHELEWLGLVIRKWNEKWYYKKS